GHAGGLASAERYDRGVHHRDVGLGLLVAGFGPLPLPGDAPLEARQVGDHQFGVDRLGIGYRIDLARHVRDLAVLVAAHDVDDGVDFADGGEELVAQSFALR